jgi:hypothetical protein
MRGQFLLAAKNAICHIGGNPNRLERQGRSGLVRQAQISQTFIHRLVAVYSFGSQFEGNRNSY